MLHANWCNVRAWFSSFSFAIDRSRQQDHGPVQHTLEKRVAAGTTLTEFLACIQGRIDRSIQQLFDRRQSRINVFERQVVSHNQEVDITRRRNSAELTVPACGAWKCLMTILTKVSISIEMRLMQPACILIKAARCDVE